MTGELERAVKRNIQWFGSYKRSGELVKVQVWLTVNNGCLEFLTLDYGRHFWQVPERCPTGNQRREGGSAVTKVVTIENLLGDQLTITH